MISNAMPSKVRVGVAAASLLLVAACSTEAPTNTTEGVSGEVEMGPGVTGDTIKLGLLSDLTGPFAAGSEQQNLGVELFWDQVNESGGVCDGRTVELEIRDHAYDAQQAVAAYSGMKENVLALQIVVGTPMALAVLPPMQADNMSAIPMSWSPVVLGNEEILMPGTSYLIEMTNAVDYLVEKGDLASGDSIGYVYLQGDFGEAGLQGAEFAAEEHDLTVAPYPIDPSVGDLASQVAQIQRAGDSAIFLSGTPRQTASAAAVAAAQGLDVPIIVPTPSFVPQLLDTEAAQAIADRVQVVSPLAAWTSAAEGPARLREAYEASGSTDTPAQFVLAGYMAAELMHEAIVDACEAGTLTRDGLREAFTSAEFFDFEGLGVELDFSDPDVSPAVGTFVHDVEQGVVGGLTQQVEEPFIGSSTETFVAQ